MTIYLHIGSHKTGTTAIQRYLSHHREGLRNEGIWYPKDSELLVGGRDSYNHLNFARSLDSTGTPKIYARDQLAAMATSLVAKARDFDHTIISAEAFWRIGFGRPTQDGSDAILWRRKQENVATIRRLLGDAADVTVVAVLRERGTYIQKSYSEFILATLYHKRIQKFIRYYQHTANYRKQLEAWRQHFPVRAFSYEQLDKDKKLPQSFSLALAGEVKILQDDSVRKQHFNVGHPIACVLYKRYLNGIEFMPYDTRVELYNKGRKRFTKACRKGKLAELSEINSWLSAQELRRLRRSYRDDDELIRTTFCPDFVSGPSTKEAMDREDPLVPLGRSAVLTALGWMLSKQPPARSWFTQPTP